MNIAPSNKGALIALAQNEEEIRSKLARWREALDRMGRVEKLDVIHAHTDDLESAAEFKAGEETFYLPLKGLIDFDKEYERLSKEYSAVEKELAKTEAKLSNKKFVERAPAEVVAENQARLANFKEEKERLSLALERIKKLTA
ncbi:valyl-trna synthetase [Lasius niger]|uniref:valine--tRNA ligase n=1 Tax=Lasius niger TaxID=67767 RepID=A0A0J7K0J2_LASNI|nr:valyl-trna synthetase [Lasius niger]